MIDPFEEDDVEGVFPGSTIKKPSTDYVQNICERTLGPWEITILGTPRTKKTSNELHLSVNKKYVIGWIQSLADAVHDPAIMMRSVLSRVKVQPSKRWRAWAKKAPIIMQPELGIVQMPGERPKFLSIDSDLHICATFYRESKIGDLLGYMQGLADLLQDRKVIANDRQLVNWDGSRLDKDKGRPRVEIKLYRATPIPRQPENADQLEAL